MLGKRNNREFNDDDSDEERRQALQNFAKKDMGGDVPDTPMEEMKQESP